MSESTTRFLFWDFFQAGRLWMLLAVLALGIIYIILMFVGRHRGVRYTQTGVVGTVLPRQRQWRRHLAVVAGLCSLTLIIGAWARPAGEEKVPRQRATIAIVLDRSLSMQATDVQPNRFDASKQAAARFLDTLPSQYNVSVTGLSGSPTVLMPASTDRGATKRAIELMDMQEGTAIGDALTQALKTIATAPGEGSKGPAPGVIVLLSDGGDTGGEYTPSEAVEAASAQDVPIYTIAYGTQNGFVDVDGKRENVAPDLELMRQIAKDSGGEMMDADNASELDNVYQKMRSEVTYEKVKKEVSARWALYSLACALLTCFGAVSMAARWP
uniref:VWA domain-containing protein n=1 Tax=Vaginimicrobium propionicum TaxID=1871034 RepID=UPI0009FAFE6E|nr:VWA domain-containing protein [Vaginimicrobium propionicum]